MIKICKKKDCNNTAITRGKYCNMHRTNKAKNNILVSREETKYNDDEDIEIALKLSLETLKIEKTNKISKLIFIRNTIYCYLINCIFSQYCITIFY